MIATFFFTDSIFSILAFFPVHLPIYYLIWKSMADNQLIWFVLTGQT